MVKILSSKNYKESSQNYGDCIIFVEGKTAIIFDCGSKEHAERAIEILNKNNIEKATVILSHNDDDHFKGIPHLITEGRVDKLFTILFFEYTKELLDTLDDERRNEGSIGRAIEDLYDNISSLIGTVTLKDVYKDESELPSQVEFVGPTLEYMLQAAAKGINNNESDIIDGETITNAASVQIKLTFDNKTILLTGDCAPEAIPDTIDLKALDYIQLPHHGKPSLADEIFERVYPSNSVVYIVSDNTGNSNGGSTGLNKRGKNVKNTKNDGDIDLTNSSNSTYTGRILGKWDIC